LTDPIQPAQKPAYLVTWAENDDAGRKAALAQIDYSTDAVKVFHRASARNSFQNVTPNTSVREGFARADYDYFRPGEQLPTEDSQIIDACMQAYDRIGIVHNIVDMMSDFACQGIDVVHKQPSRQKFFQEWFRRVNGPERTERMLNMLYRAGNVVVRRTTSVIPRGAISEFWRAKAKPDLPSFPADPKLDKGEIPAGYAIFDPRSLCVDNPGLASMLGPNATRFSLKIPAQVARTISSPKTSADRDAVAKLPPAVVAAARGNKLVPLPADKVVTLYYKKDDHQVWAKPMTYCILSDLQALTKLKMADLAALDGAVSHIRLWRLGSLENRIFPSAEAINRLAEVLLNNVGGGSIDLIWGPELDLVETSSDISQFLGEEKYKSTLSAIFQGLGIPPSLTGTQTGSTANNFISLRTLIERLQYGRDIVTTFWENEFRLVQRAMGFAQPAQVVFDQHTLSDEAAEKKLLIELLDRGVISEEALQERFDLIPEIEEVRRRREERKRAGGKLPPKASPYHNPQQKEAKEKILLQTGAYPPSAFGIELQEAKPGEKAPADLLPQKAAPEGEKPGNPDAKGNPNGGRPPNVTETQKRKKKPLKPRLAAKFAQALAWYDHADQQLIDLTQQPYLRSIGRKSRRELAGGEADDYERFRSVLLANLPFGERVTAESVAPLLARPLGLPPLTEALYRQALSRTPEATLDQKRRLFSAACALAVYSTDEVNHDEDHG
jgi:hypothetical protein